MNEKKSGNEINKEIIYERKIKSNRSSHKMVAQNPSKLDQNDEHHQDKEIKKYY